MYMCLTRWDEIVPHCQNCWIGFLQWLAAWPQLYRVCHQMMAFMGSLMVMTRDSSRVLGTAESAPAPAAHLLEPRGRGSEQPARTLPHRRNLGGRLEGLVELVPKDTTTCLFDSQSPKLSLADQGTAKRLPFPRWVCSEQQTRGGRVSVATRWRSRSELPAAALCGTRRGG